jgi:acyl transferase domain-containing protein
MNLISQDEDMREAISKWMAGNKLSRLAQVWVRGVELDWEKLYAETQSAPERISLPTYPFAREHYWIDGGASARQAGRAPDADAPADADDRPTLASSLRSIEDIINRVDDGSMETNQAVAFLKMVV